MLADRFMGVVCTCSAGVRGITAEALRASAQPQDLSYCPFNDAIHAVLRLSCDRRTQLIARICVPRNSGGQTRGVVELIKVAC